MYVFHKLIKIKTKHYEHPVQLICQRTKFIFQTKVIKDYETHLDNVIDNGPREQSLTGKRPREV